MDKKDIEELEKWQREKEYDSKATYGYDLTKLAKEAKKSTQTINNVTNATRKIGISLKNLLRIIFAIAIFIGIYFLFAYLNSIKSNVDINVLSTLKSMYGKDLKIISQDIDGDGNGTYQVQTVGNDKIKFTIIKKYGNFNSDYSASCMKYYFEKWNSNSKNIFKAEKTKDSNGLLKYDLYEDINSFNEIDNAVEKYEEFKEFAKEYYYQDWNIWLRKGNFKYPIVSGTGYNKEAIINNLKRKYILINKENGISLQDVSDENMKKYNKPDSLAIIINGEKLQDESDPQNSTVTYDDNIQEYKISMKEKILSKINSVQNIKKSMGVIKSFQINGNKYTLTTQAENIDKKLITYDISISTFQKIFNAKVKYNYDEGIIKIDV